MTVVEFAHEVSKEPIALQLSMASYLLGVFLLLLSGAAVLCEHVFPNASDRLDRALFGDDQEDPEELLDAWS